MEYISLFVKGIIIGIGKIIPGVSGSMLAISLGLYEKIINAISNIFKNFKENARFLINVGLGIVVSVILISRLIILCLNKNYFLVMMLFIGLIIGGIISIFKLVKKDIRLKNIMILFIPFLLFYVFNILTNNLSVHIKFTPLNCILLGMLEALTMIIPGISGTAVMMMLGVYEEQLKMFSDINYFFNLALFMIGILITTFLLSNVITKVLNKYRESSYYLIIGFAVSSVIALLKMLFLTNFTFSELVLGIVLLLLGTFISYKLE